MDFDEMMNELNTITWDDIDGDAFDYIEDYRPRKRRQRRDRDEDSED